MPKKWVTLGSGNDSHPVPIEPHKRPRVETSGGLFEIHDELPPPYRDALDTVINFRDEMLNNIEEELDVKEQLRLIEQTFEDPEAYDELQELIGHIFSRMSTMESHFRNINRTGISNGIDLRYIGFQLGAIDKQAQYIEGILDSIPQRYSEYGRRAVENQRRVDERLARMRQKVEELKNADYSVKKPTAPPSTDWRHLKKRALRRYANRRDSGMAEYSDLDFNFGSS